MESCEFQEDLQQLSCDLWYHFWYHNFLEESDSVRADSPPCDMSDALYDCMPSSGDCFGVEALHVEGDSQAINGDSIVAGQGAVPPSAKLRIVEDNGFALANQNTFDLRISEGQMLFCRFAFTSMCAFGNCERYQAKFGFRPEKSVGFPGFQCDWGSFSVVETTKESSKASICVQIDC